VLQPVALVLEGHQLALVAFVLLRFVERVLHL
jgi:hypothetical protein